MTTMRGLIMVLVPDAGVCGPCQLAGADDDWRAGHGAAPDEQLQLLDPSVCFRDAHYATVHGGR